MDSVWPVVVVAGAGIAANLVATILATRKARDGLTRVAWIARLNWSADFVALMTTSAAGFAVILFDSEATQGLRIAAWGTAGLFAALTVACGTRNEVFKNSYPQSAFGVFGNPRRLRKIQPGITISAAAIILLAVLSI